MRIGSMKKRLGDILVEVGIITPAQLKEALDIQKRSGGKLGTILAQMGAINEEVMLAFLGKQCGVSYISLAEFGTIPDDVVRSVPESLVRRQNLIPISIKGDKLTVAMSDPFNIFALDDLKLMTGYEVEVVIASESEIKSAIAAHYTHQPELVAVLQQKSGDGSFESLVLHAVNSKASAILMEPFPEAVRVRYKIDGILYEQAFIARELYDAILGQMKGKGAMDIVEGAVREGHAGVRCGDHELTCKLLFMSTVLGESVKIEMSSFESVNPDLNKLGFETETIAVFKKNIMAPGGLTLITGPVNSGKKLTFYSAMSSLNYPDRDIVSIEQHVSCVVPGVRQFQFGGMANGGNPARFAALLDQKPDIIFVDEINDRETAKLCVSAALSGRTVISAMRAIDAAEAIARLRRMGIDPFLLASAITMVVNQRLMRTICPECKEMYEISRPALKALGMEIPGAADGKKTHFWRGKGCQFCNYTGYSGRTGLFEVVEVDEGLRRLVITGSDEMELRAEVVKRNVVGLNEAALRKVLAGISTAEEMLRLTKLPVYPG